MGRSHDDVKGVRGPRCARWSAEELSALAEHYPVHGGSWEGWETVLPGRSLKAIQYKAHLLSLKAPGAPRPWTEGEDEALMREFPAHGAAWEGWAELLPDRSRAAIAARGRLMAPDPSGRTSRHWAPEEDEALRRLYPTHASGWAGWPDILPGRTPTAISNRAGTLGLCTRRRVPWTEGEDDAVRAHYPEHGRFWEGWEDLLPGRTPPAIARRAQLLKIRKGSVGNRWSEAEEEAVAREFPSHGQDWEGWAEILPGRTPGAIKARASALGVGLERGPVPWTEAEDETLIRHYPAHGSRWAGWATCLPGRSASAIAVRASKFSLVSWSSADVRTLKNLYPFHGARWKGWARVLPGVSTDAIERKAGALGLETRSEERNSRPWTDHEDDLVRELFPTKGQDWEGWASVLPGRTQASVACRARVLKAVSSGGRPWSEQEDDVVRLLFPVHGASWKGWSSVLTGRSAEAVTRRARTLGLPADPGRPSRWTAEEEALVVEHYPGHGAAWEGWKRLLPRRSPGAIGERALRLGVRKYPRIGR
jgi:hypothetical protein